MMVPAPVTYVTNGRLEQVMVFYQPVVPASVSVSVSLCLYIFLPSPCKAASFFVYDISKFW